MFERIVIVGAGQAAAQAIDTLRRKGFAGSIMLIGDEPYLPYQRPPLSKKYLAGSLERERLAIRPAHYYTDHSVDLRLGRRATEIDRGARRVLLDDGSAAPYDALLLATGSRPRPLPCPGGDLGRVFFLRSMADVERIRGEFAASRRIVIVGGGYIGLEVAATARELGHETTILEMADRPMNRVTCAPVSEYFAAEHARHGVRIVCNARVLALRAGAAAEGVETVHCDDGTEYVADLVVVGVGVAPADELAAAAGLPCDNGIVVDEYCRTADPAIYAAGDCTNHKSLHYARRVRLESVDNAFEQGTSAALALLGTPLVHDKVPWFWSDQYHLKLVIVGLSQGYDTLVLRGDAASGSFSACYLRDGELIAIDTVNSAKDQMAARKLIAARGRPNLAKLGDPSIALRDTL